MKYIEKRDLKRLEEVFDECVKVAIKIGRKYMKDKKITKEVTSEEWKLALILLNKTEFLK